MLLASLFFGQASLASPVYDYKDFKGLIESSLAPRKISASPNIPSSGITSHHLPVAAPLIAEFYLTLKNRRPDIKSFVIIGPDHFEKCHANFSINNEKIETSFGRLCPDKKIVDDLSVMGANLDKKCFENEHAIGVEANYIKKLYPDASVTPILFSYSARFRNLSKLVKYFTNQDDIFVLGSMDFSHYQKNDKADLIDEISKKKIEALNGQGLELANVDSPATLKLMLDLAKLRSEKAEILDHKNSSFYTGDKNNTTSYFDVFFGNKKN